MRFHNINILKNTGILFNCKRFKSESISNIWKSVVGLEVHAQLNSESKLFSRAQNTFGGAVNNCVSFLDASIPGTLPVLNRKCVELGIKTALALSCKVNEVSLFDRKHYFYADLPAGYQITQQRAPLASDGVIHFQVFTPGIHKKPYDKCSKIKQIQLEQDSGKSLHDEELKRSLVDLNRAGAPLIELVFEPDLTDGEEAAALVKELVLIVQRLEACSGKMEEGALRVDANVSVHKPGEPLGTRTEIKNIGSVRGVAGAIGYEISRQMAVLDGGGTVANETRSWDAVNRLTVPMRDKEVVLDYRFMPEPNLPPLRVNTTTTEDVRDMISVPLLKESLPGLPEESRKFLSNEYNLKSETVIQLVNEPVLLDYFLPLALNKSRNPFKVANLLLNDLLTVLNKKKIPIEACSLTTTQLGQLVDFLLENKINLETCKIVISDMLDSQSEVLPFQIIENKGLWLVTDDDIITRRCQEIIQSCPTLVKKYKSGKVKIFKALLGMIATKYKNDKIDMKKVSTKLEELLKK